MSGEDGPGIVDGEVATGDVARSLSPLRPLEGRLGGVFAICGFSSSEATAGDGAAGAEFSTTSSNVSVVRTAGSDILSSLGAAIISVTKSS